MPGLPVTGSGDGGLSAGQSLLVLLGIVGLALLGFGLRRKGVGASA